jgi:hypothetical protein
MGGDKVAGDEEEGRRNWRGGVNGILYAVQFDRELNDTVVQKIVTMIRKDDVLPGGATRFAAAIHEALAQDGPLNDVIETAHSEVDIRAFLAKVRASLAER